MEAWVEEAVNESSKAIDWLYSDSFDFDFFFVAWFGLSEWNKWVLLLFPD